jgi:hypothetical protein
MSHWITAPFQIRRNAFWTLRKKGTARAMWRGIRLAPEILQFTDDGNEFPYNSIHRFFRQSAERFSNESLTQGDHLCRFDN